MLATLCQLVSLGRLDIFMALALTFLGYEELSYNDKFFSKFHAFL